MYLELTIPVLNEEETLKEKIHIIMDFLNVNLIQSFKVIIADNGSTDKTEKYSKDLMEIYKEKLEYLKLNEKGVGLALKASWCKSAAKYVGYMDLDIATDLKHLLEVIEIFEKTNVKIINGSRLLKDSKVINRTLIREVTSRAFNYLVKKLLKVKFTDGMCGFKFFDRKIAQGLIENGIKTNSWFFSTEILVKATWNKIIITEIPVTWTDDRKSKVKLFKLSFDYLKNILRLRKEKKTYVSIKYTEE